MRSGVALLLETARIMSSREWNQTIMFIAMAAEEQGTFGARHFAQNAFLDNLNILAVINYDGVGGRLGIPQLAAPVRSGSTAVAGRRNRPLTTNISPAITYRLFR